MGGFRLLLENFIKYGFRIDPREWFIVLTGRDEGDSSYPSVVLAMCKLITFLKNVKFIINIF
jgi:diacylglycerol O-acyltransferase-1